MMLMSGEPARKRMWPRILLAMVGFVVIISPLNPFIEYKDVGDDEILTNSSFVVMAAISLGYWWIVLKYLKS